MQNLFVLSNCGDTGIRGYCEVNSGFVNWYCEALYDIARCRWSDGSSSVVCSVAYGGEGRCNEGLFNSPVINDDNLV